MADGADIGRHLELEAGLAEGLQLHARRALGGVAEDDGDAIAFFQEATAAPASGCCVPAIPGPGCC